MARITRARSAIQLDKGDLAILDKKLEEVVRGISNLTKVREIIEPAGEVVKEAARGLVKESDAPHFRYKTAKLVKSIRAPKGKGVKVATYVPGNLRKSIVDLAERRKKYRTYRVIIGPFYRSFRSLLKSGIYGNSDRTADGYYAHMAYKSSLNFRKEVTGRALQQNKSRVLQIITRGVIDYMKEQNRGT